MRLLDLVEVYIASSAIEVTAVVGVLEAAGLEARIRDMTITPYPVSIGPLGEKRISVPSNQAEEAREVLRQAVEDGFLRSGGRIVEDRPVD